MLPGVILSKPFSWKKIRNLIKQIKPLVHKVFTIDPARPRHSSLKMKPFILSLSFPLTAGLCWSVCLSCQESIVENIVGILQFGRYSTVFCHQNHQGQTVSVSGCHRYVNETQCQTSTIFWCTYLLLFHRSSVLCCKLPHTLTLILVSHQDSCWANRVLHLEYWALLL